MQLHRTSHDGGQASGGTVLVAIPRAPVPPTEDVALRSLPRLALGLAWLTTNIATLTITGDLLIGVLLVIGIVGTALLATEDRIGAVGLSGVFAPLSVLLLGWPAGTLIALGTVVIGDNIIRATPVHSVVWHGALLSLMLTAGAWVTGVPHAPALPPVIGPVLGFAWCGIYAGWGVAKGGRDGTVAAVAQAGAMIGVMISALSSPWWLPLLPTRIEAVVEAGLKGMGFAAAFMLADFIVSSLATIRSGRNGSLAFWLDHLPVLFVRYGLQGIAAGLILYWYDESGASALGTAAAALLVLQAAYHFYRRAEDTTESVIAALASAIDARDPYTAGHSARVAEYAAFAAVQMGWSKGKVRRTQRAGLLHDIGKLGVPDAVLHKPASLSAVEFEQMKRHASFGEQIVGQVHGLRDVARIVGQDHEHWTGGGYPRGLSGSSILEEARLIAVADVFDAMTTDRPYRPALPKDEAIQHLRRVAGSQLDPDLTNAFVRAMDRASTIGVALCFCATH